MSGKGFSILLVPRDNESSGVREVRLSGTALISIGVGCLIAAIGFVAMLSTYGLTVVDQVKYSRLENENTILRRQLTDMNASVMSLADQMTVIAERDEAVRLAAELEPLPEELRRAGIGGSYRDFDREVTRLSGEPARLTKETQTLINRLSREMKLETESLLEVNETLEGSDRFLRGYPSIFPVDQTKYRAWVTSLYQFRTDPLYGDRRFHYGNDIGAARGTPVRATADGVIERVENGVKGPTKRGLGNNVRIDHQNGYKTIYAHMDRVKSGLRQFARVKRGDIIGYVGSTGRTDGIHLHYQVEYMGKAVNPYWHYYDQREAEVLGKSNR
jgi:murein DD-endopeptidase MepM/ murein hydrolase activator NlpD